jgi:hypothetical protein
MRSSATLALIVLVSACSPRREPETPSASAALQSFYDAYLPAFKQGRFRAFLDDSTTLVAPALRRALIADYQASAADSTQVVGLDFDPFLNSQDPCSGYRVGADSAAGARHFIRVRAMCPGDTALAAVAVLEQSSHRWELVDLHYPGDTSTLQGILARLARERARPTGAGAPNN